MHHTLTTHDVARIQEAALRLPHLRKCVYRMYTGKELIALEIPHCNGKPVEPNQIYRMKTIKEVNLVAVMTKLCQEEGAAVLDAVMPQLLDGNWEVDEEERIVFTTENHND